ncbi:MAG: TIGR02217 family protein [Proteobacteria bacterium]|jgi:uncharacterized protein (TIGR02217 family)|nr:DUF2460 domain-containing protein [Alphaproteobacteria bacterium]NCC03353.1 TIGR02217 family protein [Pseudomonadota bacterium]
MAFDEIRLPLKIRYGAQGGPHFMTEIVTLQSGHEQRNQLWAQARRRYNARTGITTASEAAQLLAFFQARAGRARGFRLKDWSDYSSTADGISAPDWNDQIIATGDGTTTQFQLCKSYGGGEGASKRDIAKPVADTVRVGVDSVEIETGWSIDETSGIVTFSQAPASGAVIYAGFQFDVPVRFDSDRLSLTADDRNLAQSEEDIPLVELRV